MDSMATVLPRLVCQGGVPWNSGMEAGLPTSDCKEERTKAPPYSTRRLAVEPRDGLAPVGIHPAGLVLGNRT